MKKDTIILIERLIVLKIKEVDFDFYTEDEKFLKNQAEIKCVREALLKNGDFNLKVK